MKIEDIALLEIFIKVNQLGSFTKAANALGVTSSVISKKIAFLEKSLKITLFLRTTRQLSLTQDGQKLLQIAEPIIESMNDLNREFDDRSQSEVISGTIRLSSAETYANSRLVPAICAFNRLHPEIQFDLVLSNSHFNLIEQNLDMTIRIFKPVDSSLKSLKLEDNDLIFCASPAFLKKNGPLTTIKSIQNFPFLCLQMHEAERFKKSGELVGSVFKNKPLTANSGEALNQFCINGFGVTLRSRWDVEKYLKEKKLVELKLNDSVVPTSAVYVLYTASNFIPKKTRVFIDFLKDFIKKTIDIKK